MKKICLGFCALHVAEAGFAPKRYYKMASSQIISCKKFRNFSELAFCKTPPDDCFWTEWLTEGKTVSSLNLKSQFDYNFNHKQIQSVLLQI